MTAEDIEAKMTPAGGYTRATLAEWSVPWPPPKGWKTALVAQGIEAGTGETRQGLDAKHKSPVAEGHAPEPSQPSPEHSNTTATKGLG